MPSWKSLLNSDPTDWLLEPYNPSVRYFALTGILDEIPSSEIVRNARTDIMNSGVVPAILNKQSAEGYWDEQKKFYTAKYTGTVWQLMILAELGADGNNPQIARACEFILEHSQELGSGGFSTYKSEKTGGGLPSYVIPCLTGNLVWSLIRLGYLNDERIQKGIDWINKYQRFDDGIASVTKGWPYDRYEMCWGKHTCHLGAVKALKALAEIPAGMRSDATIETINQGVEYLLLHHIYKKSHDLSSVSKPGWLRLGFPLMYQSDILEILLILAQLNCRDQRMQDAIDIVLSKQDQQGKWKLENSFNGKFVANIEKKGNPSKWITLNALRVLKYYYGE
ncbi:MAG: nitrogen fixation protein NifH [Bacteroidia bacterium]|nr:nitrogen fixation protein NifH [Bacteroidia bacterium]